MKNESFSFSDAIVHLHPPLQLLIKELSSHRDVFILLKMRRLGIAAAIGDKNSEMDIVHFNVDQQFLPSFESGLATGGPHGVRVM